MQFVRAFGFATLAFVLSGCAALSLFDGPDRDHVTVANGSGYNVAVVADGRKLLVSLDTQSAVDRRMLSAATLGTVGPPASEFDAAASQWLKIEKAQCKASNGQRTSFGSFEYDLTCAPADAPK